MKWLLNTVLTVVHSIISEEWERSDIFWKPKEMRVHEIKLPKFMAKRTFAVADLDPGGRGVS